MSRSQSIETPAGRHRLLSTKPLLAIVAFLALLFMSLPVAAAFAAAPASGTYAGDSTAYNGAKVTFSIDASGRMSNFSTQSYCTDGLFLNTVQWTDMPATPVEVGVPFSLRWEYGTADVRPYYELTGVINADGTASGTGRAGFLPSGTCGGLTFNWTAQIDGGVPTPTPTASASPESLTKSELAASGTTISGAKFPANAAVTLTIDGAPAGSKNANANGDVSFAYTSSSLSVGAHEAVLTSGSASAKTSFTVTEDPIVFTPEAAVTPATLTISELASSGVTTTGRGFPADTNITFAIDGATVQTRSSNANGEVAFDAHTSDTLGTGAHAVLLTAGTLRAESSFTVTADPIVYNPSATVTPERATVSEMASTGVRVSGSGFAPSSEVTFTVDGTNVATASSNGNGEVAFDYTSALIGVGTHDAALSAAEGTANVTFTVTADPVVYDPTIAISPASLTESDLANPGATITGKKFPANTDVALSVNGVDVATSKSDADGTVAFSYTSTTLGVGSHQVRLAANAPGAAVEGSLEVTKDPVVNDPTVALSPRSLTESELGTSGTTITGRNFPANGDVVLSINGNDVDTSRSDADGTVEFSFKSTTLGAGSHTVRLAATGTNAAAVGTLEVTSDPIVYNPTATATPQKLTQSELADNGIIFTGEGFPAGTDIVLAVGGANVQTMASDANGAVTFTAYTSPLGIGQHTATLTAGTLKAEATFTITKDADTPGPIQIPATTPSASDLDPALDGAIEAPSQAKVGETVTLKITGAAPGTEVGVWIFGAPTYLGTHKVGADGTVKMKIVGVSPGAAKIGVWAAPDKHLGWDSITIVGDGGSDPGDGDDGGKKPGNGNLAETGGSGAGLAIGATLGGLLLAAGAGVMLRRRRAAE